MGGNTEFADSRTAWDELDEASKKELEEKEYIGAHTLLHSRKIASPEYFKDLDPTSLPMARHKILQTHEPSGRKTLYMAAHCHHIETASGPIPKEESDKWLERLMQHITQPKYVMSVEWLDEGDMVAWDNTSVMHRATGGTFAGKYARDVRRTTVHDDSSTAWGLNRGMEARGFDAPSGVGEAK